MKKMLKLCLDIRIENRKNVIIKKIESKNKNMCKEIKIK